MLTVISPDQFKAVPWKNGKGQTLQLAINENGNINDFVWRLSIAKVVEDGVFSYFEGYTRHLILLDGNGLSLCHDDHQTDHLNAPLDWSRFDGASKTYARLTTGEITDFNLMTQSKSCEAKIETYRIPSQITLAPASIVFIYPLSSDLAINDSTGGVTNLPAKHLAQFDQSARSSQQSSPLINHYQVSGENFIVFYIMLND